MFLPSVELSFCLLLLPLSESVIILCFNVRSFMSILVLHHLKKGKKELVALLNLSSWCLVMIERLFLAVPWGCLRFVIVVFPDHTHYFSSKNYIQIRPDDPIWFQTILSR